MLLSGLCLKKYWWLCVAFKIWGLVAVCLIANFPGQEILCGLDAGWLVELVVPVLVPPCRIGLLEARLPKYHISTAWAKRSGANAWASAHALSMVTWYHQKIVNGYCLFEPLLLRVLIMNLQIVSVVFCHSALQMLSVGVSFIPTLAFCPPNMHIFQSLHTKS